MSLNDIDLQPAMICSFYQNALVEIENPKQEPKDKSAMVKPALKFLGSNKKNILILVNQKEAPFLPDTELNFLGSVLAACKLSLADVALINTFQMDQQDLESQFDLLQPRQVLMFGVEPNEIGLPVYFPQYQLQPFSNRTWMHAPALHQLHQDKAAKQQLWLGLKNMMGV